MVSNMEGARFAFGENWLQFASRLDESQAAEAEMSLRSLLGRDDLVGARFVDIGCGSGLFSLAAHRLGARVHSFDFDPDSVACTQALRNQHGGDTRNWTVERGSILEA